MNVAAVALPREQSASALRPVAVAAVLFFTYAFFGMSWMGAVPVMPELTAALHKERADGALLISIVSMAKSVVPILAGVLAARLGLSRMMRGAAVLILAGGLVPWIDGWLGVLAARFLFGVGGAVWVTLMGSVVMAGVEPKHRALVNALNGVAVNTGVIAALALTLPLSQAIGWRLALSSYSVAGAVCLLGLLALGELAPAQARATSSLASTLRDYGRTLRQPTAWLLAVAFAGPLALYLVLNTFLGAHLEARFGLPRQSAMQWLSYLNLWGIPSAIGAGLLLSKVWKSPRPYLVIAAVVLPLAVAGAVQAESDGARAVLFALVGFATFLPVSPLITALQRIPGQSPASVGMILGTMFAVTYVVSSVVPQAIAPLVAAGVPLESLLVVAGTLGATPLCGLLLPRGDG